MSRAPKPLLVGLDVGGTKTSIRLEDALTGETLADRTIANTGWERLNDGDRARSLLEWVRDATSGRPVGAVAAGVHGNDSPEQARILRAPLEEAFARIDLLNDSHLLVLACGHEEGTGVIAGTGSSATSVGPDGRVQTVGGWGWLLGDEGGAAGLVRDAAREVLAAHDTGSSDPLSPLLLDALGLRYPNALTMALGNTEPRLWAAAASVVFKAASVGSQRATQLISRHANSLAELVALLKRRGGNTKVVVCAGGVFRNQPPMFEAFCAAMGRMDETSEVILLEDEPVSGALALARKRFQQLRPISAFEEAK